jgi:hypothetical protein
MKIDCFSLFELKQKRIQKSAKCMNYPTSLKCPEWRKRNEKNTTKSKTQQISERNIESEANVQEKHTKKKIE